MAIPLKSEYISGQVVPVTGLYLILDPIYGNCEVYRRCEAGTRFPPSYKKSQKFILLKLLVKSGPTLFD